VSDIGFGYLVFSPPVFLRVSRTCGPQGPGNSLQSLNPYAFFQTSDARIQRGGAMRLFLTGNPGVGKTTLIRAIVQRLNGITCAGFYTEDTRERGQRTGFRIVTLDGQKGILATLGQKKPTVGKYSIHVEEFEKLVLTRLDQVTNPADLYVIDEIGKMELLSRQFRVRIIELLAQPTNLFATISKKGDGFIDQIKRRSDIEIIEVTRKNRDELPEELARKIKTQLTTSLR
jgi:nucleoside-triphosphatase